MNIKYLCMIMALYTAASSINAMDVEPFFNNAIDERTIPFRSIHVGQSFDIRLALTGELDLAYVSDNIELLGEPLFTSFQDTYRGYKHAIKTPTGVIGRDGSLTWQFNALAAGQAQISFSLTHDDGSVIIYTYMFNVTDPYRKPSARRRR